MAAESSHLFVERIKPTRLNGQPLLDDSAAALGRAWEKSLSTPGLRIEDGENFDDLVARADRALAFLEGRPERAIVVVTHGYFLRTILCRVLFGDLLAGEIFRRFQRAAAMENTGLTVLRYERHPAPFWRLWVYNDHSHLD